MCVCVYVCVCEIVSVLDFIICYFVTIPCVFFIFLYRENALIIIVFMGVDRILIIITIIMLENNNDNQMNI